jgi:hypothetical protein
LSQCAAIHPVASLLLHTSRTVFAEFLMLPKKVLDTRTRIA